MLPPLQAAYCGGRVTLSAGGSLSTRHCPAYMDACILDTSILACVLHVKYLLHAFFTSTPRDLQTFATLLHVQESQHTLALLQPTQPHSPSRHQGCLDEIKLLFLAPQPPPATRKQFLGFKRQLWKIPACLRQCIFNKSLTKYILIVIECYLNTGSLGGPNF